jgi:hypothetical protein
MTHQNSPVPGIELPKRVNCAVQASSICFSISLLFMLYSLLYCIHDTMYPMYCTSIAQSRVRYLVQKYDYFSLLPHHSLQTYTLQLYNANLANFCPPRRGNNTYDKRIPMSGIPGSCLQTFSFQV